MRSSHPSTTKNLDHNTMYGHTFISYGHDGVICAYSAQGANPAITADMGRELMKIIPGSLTGVSLKSAQWTLFSCHHARIAGQKRG
jgi:hypothetical protein